MREGVTGMKERVIMEDSEKGGRKRRCGANSC